MEDSLPLLPPDPLQSLTRPVESSLLPMGTPQSLRWGSPQLTLPSAESYSAQAGSGRKSSPLPDQPHTHNTSIPSTAPRPQQPGSREGTHWDAHPARPSTPEARRRRQRPPVGQLSPVGQPAWLQPCCSPHLTRGEGRGGNWSGSQTEASVGCSHFSSLGKAQCQL